jgi:hypothetical protein
VDSVTRFGALGEDVLAGGDRLRRLEVGHVVRRAGAEAGSWCLTLVGIFVGLAWDGCGSILQSDYAARAAPCEGLVVRRGETVGGIAILWTAGLPLTVDMPLAAGWLGILGFLLAFHFGLFRLLALGWQQLGVAAEPLMNSPLRAQTVSEFWSSRWNRAFRDVAHPLVFRPVARRFGVAVATAAGFLASGLIHDLVISLPARSEFGLPTRYFLIQAAAILAERSAWGRRLRFAAGAGECLFVAVVILAPAGLLFHPPFIRQVVLPMLAAIHGG